MLRARAHHDEAQGIQSSAISIQTCIALFFRWSRTSRQYFWFTVTPKWYKFFTNYPTRIKQIMTIVLIFHLLRQAYLCLGDCGVCHSRVWLLVSGSYLRNQPLSPVMTWLRKSGSVPSCSSISAYTLFQQTSRSSLKFFGTTFAHVFMLASSNLDWRYKRDVAIIS